MSADVEGALDRYHGAALRIKRQRDDLLTVLKWFLDDTRFQVAVGGNPNMVEKMLSEARSTYLRIKSES